VPDTGEVKEHFHDIADLLVCVDDNGPGLEGQDILIRPNLVELPKPAGLPAERYWTGQVILHPDFAKQRPLSAKKNSGRKELIVCFGGSDPNGITLRAANIVKRLGEEVLVRIVLGAAFPWDEKVALLVGQDARFLIERNIPDMARVLGNADIALISGGTLLYEACASGVPSVVVCQNEEQRAEADAAHAAGAVISLGVSAQVPDEQILSAVERLLGDAALRQTMAGKGCLLVAPDGAARLAARLLSFLKKGDKA
jgi:spore coat polysaccharide biosynthesis predicted glycosyltransferase SpsG